MNAKLLPLKILSGLWQDNHNSFPFHAIIATDASVQNEKAGVGIFSSQFKLDLFPPFA